jgi:hypothetical protein
MLAMTGEGPGHAALPKATPEARAACCCCGCGHGAAGSHVVMWAQRRNEAAHACHLHAAPPVAGGVLPDLLLDVCHLASTQVKGSLGGLAGNWIQLHRGQQRQQ